MPRIYIGGRKYSKSRIEIEREFKTLYRDLVEEKIIPEIKEDGDSDLTIEEIDLIGSHLDKEIEDCAQIRKQTRKELKDETVDAHLFNFLRLRMYITFYTHLICKKCFDLYKSYLENNQFSLIRFDLIC